MQEENNMRTTEIQQECVICGNPIYRGGGGLQRTKRSKNSVTCSPKCSRRYVRIVEKERNRKNGEMNKKCRTCKWRRK